MCSGGSAGAIAALEVLNRISASDHLLNAAVLCGERLLLTATATRKGCWLENRDRFEPAADRILPWRRRNRVGAAQTRGVERAGAFPRVPAESAIAYERSTFVAEEANWPDYRTGAEERISPDPRFMVAWCHGAPGIGLARIDSLQHMDDRETREEIQIALSKNGRHADFGSKPLPLVTATLAIWIFCFTPPSGWMVPGGVKPESGWHPRLWPRSRSEDAFAACRLRWRRRD